MGVLWSIPKIKNTDKNRLSACSLVYWRDWTV